MDVSLISDAAIISGRIDRLLSQVDTEVSDKTINIQVGKAIGVTPEMVRQWRKNVSLPRYDSLNLLVMFLVERKIPATPQYILCGTPPKPLSPMELRERIVDDGPELELLRAFRATNPDGQKRVLDHAETILKAYPRPANVQSLSIKKRRT